jgi:hypothetical protein
MRRTNHRRRERGITFPLLAISMVGLLGFAGLVTDGTRAYAERRQVQNAADAAALAGANALNRFLLTTGTANSIQTAAVQAAGDNGVDAAEVTCQLVRSGGGTQACPTPSNGLGVPADAYTVRVTVGDTHDTTFMRVLGTDSFDVGATAAAAVRAVIIDNAPFMVCGIDDELPAQLLVRNAGGPETWPLNEAAIGTDFVIWGNDVRATDCGNPSSSFRGLVNADEPPYGIPGWWDSDTGNHAGPVEAMVLGNSACSGSLPSVGCELVLPICTAGNDQGGTGFLMYCTTAGSFEITSVTDNGTPRITATLTRGATIAQGEGTGNPQPGQARVINLVE